MSMPEAASDLNCKHIFGYDNVGRLFFDDFWALDEGLRKMEGILPKEMLLVSLHGH